MEDIEKKSTDGEIGKIVKQLRKENKMAQADLAEDLSISRSMVARIEKGERKLKLEQLVTIAEIFDVSCDYILGKTKFPKNNSKYNSEISSTEEIRFQIMMDMVLDYVKSLKQGSLNTYDIEHQKIFALHIYKALQPDKK